MLNGAVVLDEEEQPGLTERTIYHLHRTPATAAFSQSAAERCLKEEKLFKSTVNSARGGG